MLCEFEALRTADLVDAEIIAAIDHLGRHLEVLWNSQESPRKPCPSKRGDPMNPVTVCLSSSSQLEPLRTMVLDAKAAVEPSVM
jgi:hypothetical protein